MKNNKFEIIRLKTAPILIDSVKNIEIKTEFPKINKHPLHKSLEENIDFSKYINEKVIKWIIFLIIF